MDPRGVGTGLGDRTRITMPIEPALQIPNTAKPVCWLHNLAFNNAMANVAASDGTNKFILATGDGALTFQNGTQAANAPFIDHNLEKLYMNDLGLRSVSCAGRSTSTYGKACLCPSGRT
eukprot:COSAG02_NODE_1380_length_12986_cov_13.843563_1_plen_119_part_00